MQIFHFRTSWLVNSSSTSNLAATPLHSVSTFSRQSCATDEWSLAREPGNAAGNREMPPGAWKCCPGAGKCGREPENAAESRETLGNAARSRKMPPGAGKDCREPGKTAGSRERPPGNAAEKCPRESGNVARIERTENCGAKAAFNLPMYFMQRFY